MVTPKPPDKKLITKILAYNIDHIDLKLITKFNNSFKFIINKMKNDNLVDSDSNVLPSFFTNYTLKFIIRPFWNDQIQTLSDSIPIKHNLKQNLQSRFLSNTWFDHQRFLSTQTEILDIPEYFNPYDQLEKCKKIRFYPTPLQEKYFKIIFGTYRYFYNRTICVINNFNKHTLKSFYLLEDQKIIVNLENKSNITNFIFLRNTLKENYPNWILTNFNSHLISNAIREAVGKYNTCLKMYKKTKKPFTLKFKTKKKPLQTINLEKDMIKPNGLFTNWKIENTYLFRNIKLSENIPKDHIGSTLSFNNKTHKYYLNVAHKIESYNLEINKNKICAIDPGECTFLTTFSEKEILKIGNNVREKLYKKCKEVDIIKSRIDRKKYYVKKDNKKKEYEMTNKRKRNLKKAMHRKLEKIKNMKKEMHNKAINCLTSKYTTIIIPPFKVQQMVGKLSSKISRSIYTLSHYEFRKKLINKGKELGTNIKVLGEEYTSQTCGRCGNIKKDLGRSRTYRCEKCKCVMDRDINGARNILLKNVKRIKVE